jgi:tetratricopeptide (TPR) repeat protein
VDRQIKEVEALQRQRVAEAHSGLRGLGYFYRFTKEANEQARQLYEKAMALDPQYTPAYGGLGFTYFLDWLWQWNQDPKTPERALELAQKAVETVEKPSIALISAQKVLCFQ